jgi:PKD repeat protein
MQNPRFFAAAVALCAAATAQSALVVPAGYDTQLENSGNAFPFGTTGATYTGIRLQHVYDQSHFISQNVNYPVLITGLRWRAADTAATWAGGTISNSTIKLSTCPVDYTGATAVWAANEGLDVTTVYTGPITVQPGTGNGVGVIGPYHVDVQFPTAPFLYDPNQGDLVVDTDVAMPAVGGFTTMASCTAASVPPVNARRVYSSTLYPNPNAVDQNILVLEVQYTPASGLYAGFTSDVTGGASPLAVNFTDTSYSSAPGGVLAWAWDLDGDSVVDSTLQNPSFTYTNCGSYDVSLTVVDGVHGTNTITRSNYIVTDVVAPNFTYAQIAPGVFQFTDTTTPTPTNWAWDLDGDNVVDDTTQNPAFFYTNPCTAVNVTLTAGRLCGPTSSKTQQIILSPNTFLTTNQGGNGSTSTTWFGNVFDAQVNNPDGVNVCALSMRPYNFAGPFNLEWYVSSGSYLDTVGTTPRYATPSAWRLVATGSGVSSNTPFGTAGATLDFVQLNNSVYLPPGDYCFAFFINNPAGSCGLAYTNGPLGPLTDGNITAFVGGVGRGMTSKFGTGGFTPRMWNGAFHYGTFAASGDAGVGFAGLGCAGTQPTAEVAASGAPVLGTSMTLTVNNLPLGAMIMIVGYDRYQPAPFDLTAVGAPGCLVRTALDASNFQIGGSWTFNIPNNPAFSGTRLYNQALVLDPTANALGAVMSDASGMILGN